VGITYFTENGKEVAKRLKDNCPNVFFEEKPDVLELSLWVKQCFYERIPLVFICATGIAVRIIAPFVENKVVAVIPTVHGYHLITKPFDKKTFKSLYETIHPGEKEDIIKDNNPTILYVETQN
jgi:hypothetical protein